MNQAIDASGHTLRLHDGRTLGYAEYGDPAGRPLLLFPGAPSCRLFRHPDDAIAREAHARIITLDRPGYGLSTFQSGRSLLDWPRDVLELADALGLQRFAIAGVSAGGPHAAACAYAIPQRLTRVAIVSGVGPVGSAADEEGMPAQRRKAMAISRRAPWLIRPLLWLANNPSHGPEKHWRRVWADSAPCDRAVLERPEIKGLLTANWAEATRPGIRGFAAESLLLTRPWGFPLEGITAEVHLWHGEDDASIPITLGRKVAAAIPHCRATFIPGAGHFLFFDHWRQILGALLA